MTHSDKHVMIHKITKNPMVEPVDEGFPGACSLIYSEAVAVSLQELTGREGGKIIMSIK